MVTLLKWKGIAFLGAMIDQIDISKEQMLLNFGENFDFTTACLANVCTCEAFETI